MRIFRAISVLILASSLFGCGGGGDQTEISANALTVFSDGSGIAKFTSGSSAGFVYSDEIAQVIQGFRNPDDTSAVNVPNEEELPIVSSNQYTITRRGTLEAGGELVNITTLRDVRYDSLRSVFFEMPSGYVDISSVAGQEPTSLPTSGIARYTGEQTFTSRFQNAPFQRGTFTLDVNFGTRQFAYTSQSQLYSATASGIFDANTGVYASNSAIIFSNGVQYSGQFYGMLSGSGASSTAGLIVEDSAQPRFSGTYMGVR
jgi:hypothetical protein